MKIRVTLLTENDKHLDESISKERIETEAKLAWEAIMTYLSKLSNDESNAIVESCELVER